MVYSAGLLTKLRCTVAPPCAMERHRYPLYMRLLSRFIFYERPWDIRRGVDMSSAQHLDIGRC